MPKEHTARSSHITPLWCLMWLVAVFVIGISAEVLFNRGGIAASQPGTALIGLVIFGEALVYLVLLMVPADGVVPPGRTVAVTILAIGSRALMALLSMKAAIIAQYATPSPDLWVSFYAGQWLGVTVQIALIGLYLWLVRSALEIPRTGKKRARERRGEHTDYINDFRVALQPDDEESRQRQNQLLTALMENPDVSAKPLAAGTAQMLQDAGVDIPMVTASPSRTPMPTYGETEPRTATTMDTTVPATADFENTAAAFALDALMGGKETEEAFDEPPIPAFLQRDAAEASAPPNLGDLAEEDNTQCTESGIHEAFEEPVGECTDQMAPVVASLDFEAEANRTINETPEEIQELETSPVDIQGQLPLVEPETSQEEPIATPTFAQIIADEPVTTPAESAPDAVAIDAVSTGEEEPADFAIAKPELPAEQESALKSAAASVVPDGTVEIEVSATNRAYAIAGMGSTIGDTPVCMAVLRNLDTFIGASEAVMCAVHSGAPCSVILMGSAGSLVAAGTSDCGSQLVIRGGAEKKLGQLSMLARKSKAAASTLGWANEFDVSSAGPATLAAYDEASVQVKRRTGYDALVFNGNGRNVITLAPAADAAEIAAAAEQAYEAATRVAEAMKLGAVQRVLVEGQTTGLVLGPFSADSDVLIATYAESTSKMGAANVALGKFDASLRGEA